MAVLLLTLARINDAVRYARYAELASAAASLHGARFLARGAPLEVLEGELQPNRAVASFFESQAAARGYYFSPGYQKARGERLGAARFEMAMVEVADTWRS